MAFRAATADASRESSARGPPEGGGDGREGRGAVAVHPGILQKGLFFKGTVGLVTGRLQVCLPLIII